MKKLLVLTVIASFLLGSNGFAASQMTIKEEKTINAIQKAAMHDEWTQYTPAMQNGSQTPAENRTAASRAISMRSSGVKSN